MKTAVICVLLIFSAALLIYLIIMKMQLRQIREELHRNLDPSYNRQITVTLLDRSLSRLSTEINYSLDEQRRLKRDAERAERNLRQSVSDIAHDLRTPMTVIKGNLQLIENSGELSEKNAEYLSVCSEKADALRQMADTFFELSVLESDRGTVPLHTVNLTNLLMQFLADHEPVIRMHALEPDVILPEKTVFVMADPQLLARMLENLLNNTLRYAQESFQIRLEPDGVCFSNAVDAAALPDPERIFDRSYRAEASRTGRNAGLGLYIVRLLAEKQKAEASAQLDGAQLVIRLRFRQAVQ